MKLAYHPFLIHISAKRLLFVGGGQVARRLQDSIGELLHKEELS